MTFGRRFLGAALLRPSAYREIADSKGLGQATIAFTLAMLPNFRPGHDPRLGLVVFASGIVGWLLVIAIVWGLALAIPRGPVDWQRIARCVLFAAVPSALMVPLLRLAYATVHFGMGGYAEPMWLYVHVARMFVAVVLCVALGPALGRDRMETIGIAVLAAIAFAAMADMRGRLLMVLLYRS